MVNCPKCGVDVSDTYEGADPSVGMMCGGWYCDACDHAVGEHEVEREPMGGDVQPMTMREFRGERQLGTPASQISTRPGEPGYAEWVRIARSWGYD